MSISSHILLDMLLFIHAEICMWIYWIYIWYISRYASGAFFVTKNILTKFSSMAYN